jgi:hypothetical protein
MASGDDWDDADREALEPFARDLDAMRERHRHDLPIDVLRAARADALPEELQKKAGERLTSSAWARTLVDGADQAEPTLDAASADRILARIDNGSNAESTSRRPMRTWALALGSLAAVLAIAVVFWRHSSTTTTVAPQPVATAVTQPPSPPVFALELTKPDVKLTPAALLLRGEGSGRFVDDIAPGVSAFRAGDFDTAARVFETLGARYPKSVEVPFYLGVSRLFLNDGPAAVRSLESARALNDESFEDDVTWYLAVAYERAGDRAKAGELVDGLCREKSASASRACAAATKLRAGQ